MKIHGKIPEDVAVGFIVQNLSNQGLVAFFGTEALRAFRDLVTDGKTIAAAAEYRSVTGANLPECQLVVALFVASRQASPPQ